MALKAFGNEASRCDFRRSAVEAARIGLTNSKPPESDTVLAAAFDARGPDQQLHDLQREMRRWREVERAMNRARYLRADFCCGLFMAAFRWIRRDQRANRNHPSPGFAGTTMRVLLLSMAFVPVCLMLPSGPCLAQEVREMAARIDGQGNSGDRALLTGLGLAPEAIESCDDADLLWRAVRELVLTQRISEPMQQRILRRVWIVDAEVRASSVVESTAN